MMISVPIKARTNIIAGTGYLPKLASELAALLAPYVWMELLL
jgi:hypothetical protein